MTKFNFRTSVFILVFCLFIRLQPAAAAIADINPSFSGTWTPAYEWGQIFIEIKNSIRELEEFGYYTDINDPQPIRYGTDGPFPIDFIDISKLSGSDSWYFYFAVSDGEDGYEYFFDTYKYKKIARYTYLLSLKKDDVKMKVLVHNAVPTPIPTAGLLLASGILGLIGIKRRTQK